MSKLPVVIEGSKGSKSRTPVEAPNTLKSVALAYILDLVSEGEIRGLVNGLKSVYLDETPVENADGTFNFTNFQFDWRYGSQAQDHIPGFTAVENELGISLELKDDTPYERAFTNLNMDAVRVRLSVAALSKTNTSNGDITGHGVSYSIDVSTDGGPFVTKLTSSFTGKTMSKYEKDHRIELDPATTTGWIVRVRRTTPNATESYIQDKTFVESMTEIIDAKLRYPNSAIVGAVLDSSQFQNVPSRAFDLYGRIISVPTNYNPETRTYTGLWDGTFKQAWTDNPAWIYYDLVTHPVYGLGHLLDASHINKWALYRIAQYCDVMVPDGRGGMEPRFTCNLYLQRQAQAYKVIQDLATVFRGIAYWGNGEIVAVADMPEDPVYTYTPSNVIDGKFTYQGSSSKTRHTVALVSWSDQNNFGRQVVEYVDDPEGIARYGIQETDATGMGCSSQGQAQRFGRYLLATANYETQTVSFSVGLDGTLVAPGKIVRIADPLRAGVRLGGRIVAATASQVTLDGESLTVTAGDTLTIVKADGTTETRELSAVSGLTVQVSPAFSEAPAVGSVWAIDREILETQRYRIIGITENDGDVPGYTISAVQHNASKYDAVDFLTKIDEPPISQQAAPTQSPVTNLTLSHYESAGQVTTSNVLVADWTAAPGATQYEIEYRRDENEWVKLPRQNTTTVDIRDMWEGTYVVRVRAINANNIMSNPTISAPYLIADQTLLPGFVQDLQDDLLASLETLPNVVSREELVEITQHMMTLGTIAYEEAEVSAGAKYDVARAMLELAAIDAKIVSNQISIADNSTATAQLSTALGARIDDAEALILNEQTARTTADTALASDITALSAVVDDVEASVLSEATARANADTAITTTLDLIGAKSGDGLAFILNTNTAKVSPTETLAQRLSSINATTGSLQSQITSEQTARANGDTALATDMALLGAKNGAGTAWILDMSKVQVDPTTSLGVRLSSIDTRIGNAEASVTNETSARINGDNAIASNVSNLTTTVNGHTSTISTHTNSINGLSAQYTVKIDNNGYVSGFGLASTAVNGVPTSEFTVLVDKFRVVTPGATPVSPFYITGGVVYMQNVVIQNANIANLQITKLTSGTLNGDMNIGTGRIIWDNGAYMKVTGVGFGSTNQFIEWFGPKMAISSCTESNAIQYLRTDGSAYFGGSLSAGTLKTSVSDPGLGSTQVIDGPFGTNGGPINVVASYNYTFNFSSDNYTFNAGSGTTAITLTLYRKIGTGSEVQVAQQSFTGSLSIDNDPTAGEFSFLSIAIGGSITYTDTAGGTQDRTYRLASSNGTTQSWTTNPKSGGSGVDQQAVVTKRHSITTTEQ